ncbi:MAG TPA: 50S ribosomal protein L18, partial [Thermoleophilia bacterium]|nr:50S ribosomal protein L18 [Thermoleophilia bacterium]
LSVYRSNRAIYAQVVDDAAGATLVTARSSEVGPDGDKTSVSKRVGLLLAERAKAGSIEAVVFDRSGYLYHGRVKALAEGAREGGLQF